MLQGKRQDADLMASPWTGYEGQNAHRMSTSHGYAAWLCLTLFGHVNTTRPELNSHGVW